MNTFLNSSEIQLLKSTDILVVGGGSAGCVAAITAGKYGDADVTLIERYGFLGGTSTQMLDTFYGFFTPGDSPKKIVGGIAGEVVSTLNNAGEVFLRPNTYGAGTGVNYNPEFLKYTWDGLLMKYGVDCYLHTVLIDVKLHETHSECVIWTKGGIFKIEAKKVIDASGDADFCHLAGISYETAGEFDPAQSMTTTFRMANVDNEKYEKAGGKKLLSKLMVEVFESGEYDLPRKDGSAHIMNMPGCISTVAVKVTDKSALKVKELTEAEMEGRRQAFNYERFFRGKVPGYENSKIIGLSNQIGVRETRRVYGEARLSKSDCISAVVPDDTIFLCGAPIEDHRKGENGEDETYWEYIPNGGVYGVPYGTIVPKGQANVWMVGRCFSAEHEAHASCRSMAQTMSMGQAAANAAILSLNNDFAANEMNISQLKKQLVNQNVILNEPVTKAFTGKNEWGLNE